VQNKFRRVSSERQLRRWEERLHSEGNRIEKLSYISKFAHNKFTANLLLNQDSYFMISIYKSGLYKLKKK